MYHVLGFLSSATAAVELSASGSLLIPSSSLAALIFRGRDFVGRKLIRVICKHLLFGFQSRPADTINHPPSPHHRHYQSTNPSTTTGLYTLNGCPKFRYFVEGRREKRTGKENLSVRLAQIVFDTSKVRPPRGRKGSHLLHTPLGEITCNRCIYICPYCFGWWYSGTECRVQGCRREQGKGSKISLLANDSHIFEYEINVNTHQFGPWWAKSTTNTHGEHPQKERTSVLAC